MALHAKAAVLLEQATVLKAQDPTQYDPSALMGGGQPINQSEAFQRLDQLIEQFKSHFPVLEQMEVQPVERETLFVMQMMTHVATIKLHLPLADEGDMASRQKSLFAAQSIAVLTHNIVPTSSIKIEPIAGVRILFQNYRHGWNAHLCFHFLGDLDLCMRGVCARDIQDRFSGYWK